MSILRVGFCIALAGLTAGCGGGSNIFSFLGFGGDNVELFVPPPPEALDPRPLIDEVTEVTIEDTVGGIILTARGLPSTQGHFSGSLLAENSGDPIDGVLVYQFRIVPPGFSDRISTESSREVIVGAYVTTQNLAGVREIQIIGGRNTRSVRP